MKFKGLVHRFSLVLAALSCLTTFAAEPLALVSISARQASTSEPGPTIKVVPGDFVLTRTGSTDHSRTVFLAYEGSATPDLDYTALARSVIFAVGEAQHS